MTKRDEEREAARNAKRLRTLRKQRAAHEVRIAELDAQLDVAEREALLRVFGDAATAPSVVIQGVDGRAKLEARGDLAPAAGTTKIDDADRAAAALEFSCWKYLTRLGLYGFPGGELILLSGPPDVHRIDEARAWIEGEIEKFDARLAELRERERAVAALEIHLDLVERRALKPPAAPETPPEPSPGVVPKRGWAHGDPCDPALGGTGLPTSRPRDRGGYPERF